MWILTGFQWDLNIGGNDPCFQVKISYLPQGHTANAEPKLSLFPEIESSF